MRDWWWSSTTAVPDELTVSYQRKVWPETRLEESSKNHPGGFGWVHQDDWFNGHWQRAAVAVRKLDEHRAEITFKGIKTELPKANLGDYDVTFRRTYAVKVEAEGNPAIRSVYTTSAPRHTDLRVELDAGVATPGGDAMGNDGYNAAVGAVREVAPQEHVALFPTRRGPHESRPTPTAATTAWSSSPSAGSHSRFRWRASEQEGPIWYEDLGVFITKADDPTTFAQYRERVKGLKTISQQVLEHPEQSLAGAHNGQPRPHVDNYNLGCTGAAQRFWLEPNGDVTLHGPQREVAAEHASGAVEERQPRGGPVLLRPGGVAHHRAPTRSRAGDGLHHRRAEGGTVGRAAILRRAAADTDPRGRLAGRRSDGRAAAVPLHRTTVPRPSAPNCPSATRRTGPAPARAATRTTTAFPAVRSMR